MRRCAASMRREDLPQNPFSAARQGSNARPLQAPRNQPQLAERIDAVIAPETLRLSRLALVRICGC